MNVTRLVPRNAKPGGSPTGDEPGPLPQATALGATSMRARTAEIHPELRRCACGTPTDEQDIYGDPLCEECGKGCTYCADCDDEVACGYYDDGTWATHHHCRPSGIHRRITACVCNEPCANPFCTCPDSKESL